MCVLLIRREAEHQRDAAARNYSRDLLVVDWIIQINIDIKARELCGRRCRAQVTLPKRYYIRERRVLVLLGGCVSAHVTL